MEALEFDYVVVGGGGAGAVLARRLAEITNDRIALVEAGPSDEGREEVLDVRRYKEVTDGPLARLIPIVPPVFGNGRVRFPTSRVLGGSTSQNTCIWFRPPDSDFTDWQAAGAAGWGPEETAACFDALEERIHIETENPDQPPHLALLRAVEEIGYPPVDFARRFDAGIGRYRFSKKGTRRQSSSVAFLHPLSAAPKNLAVFTETEVERLILGPANAVHGVMTNRGEYLARRDVILCAGALDTPRLLMHSGIGPARQLREFGIAVRRDLQGVGAHLLDHPACCVNFSAPRPLPRHDAWNYAGVWFARVEADAIWPDIEMQIGPELFEQQTGPAGYPSAPHGFTAYFTVNRALSEGSAQLASSDWRASLKLDPAYFSDAGGYDLKVMIGGVRLSRQLFGASALREWIGHELAPGVASLSDEAIADFVRQTVTTGYHPAGTCRMGRVDDPRSVVGPDLKVIGVQNLRVADASVFPTMVSVNIAPTCMMVGYRCAELVAGKA